MSQNTASTLKESFNLNAAAFSLNAAAYGKLVEQVEEKLKLLEEREASWDRIEKGMKANAEAAANKIILDIGLYTQHMHG